MERPWETEPNELKWNDKDTGLHCWIVRVRPDSMGHLCGYVAVPVGHPIRGNWCDDFDVHGGVTWSAPREGSTKWWVGFDCAHVGDFCPAWADDPHMQGLFKDSLYRDIEYVKAECTKLARQIADWTPPQPTSDR